MELRERIAFAMWNSTNPPHIRSECTPERLGLIATPMGGGFVMELDLKIDWDLNAHSYRKLADVALREVEASRLSKGEQQS